MHQVGPARGDLHPQHQGSQAKPILALAASAKKPECAPNRARWVVNDASTGSDYYELGCADGTTAFMIRADAKGRLPRSHRVLAGHPHRRRLHLYERQHRPDGPGGHLHPAGQADRL
ncbi:MAG: hypothetical protein WDN45_02895 [Caulobacteraceae bacterium]